MPLACPDILSHIGPNSRRTTARTSPMLRASTGNVNNAVSNMEDTPLAKVVAALFRFPPFWERARQNARSMITKRAEQIGVDWDELTRETAAKGVNWDDVRAKVEDVEVTRVLPQYYTKPFHAYPKGNLSWEAALEVEAAAQSVHATVFSSDGKELDPSGDARLRSSYSDCLLRLLDSLDIRRPCDVIDLGCATGLSSMELLRVLDGDDVNVTGVDLSPFFLAVGEYLRQNRAAMSSSSTTATMLVPSAYERVKYLHRPAEDTKLPEGAYDLVSSCLTFHELPQQASKDIIKEAYRLLRPGGAFAIMDMNPSSEAFQRIQNNLFAYTAFKSTEPWLAEYASLDVHAALREAGFEVSQQLENSPRHRTIVAKKKDE